MSTKLVGERSSEVIEVCSTSTECFKLLQVLPYLGISSPDARWFDMHQPIALHAWRPHLFVLMAGPSSEMISSTSCQCSHERISSYNCSSWGSCGLYFTADTGCALDVDADAVPSVLWTPLFPSDADGALFAARNATAKTACKGYELTIGPDDAPTKLTLLCPRTNPGPQAE